MSRSTNIQQNSLRSGGSTSPGVGMRLIWQIVTGTVGEALKSGMVINVNPRRVPLSANSFTPYTQLRNLPKFSKGQVTGPIPFGPRVRGQICVNCVTTSAPHPLLFSSNINSHTRRKPGAVEGFRYSIYKRLSKGTAFAGMALRITGVLPPILPAKTHTGASRRSWQFVLFQQDFIVILQRRGPLFFHAAR